MPPSRLGVFMHSGLCISGRIVPGLPWSGQKLPQPGTIISYNSTRPFYEFTVLLITFVSRGLSTPAYPEKLWTHFLLKVFYLCPSTHPSLWYPDCSHPIVSYYPALFSSYSAVISLQCDQSCLGPTVGSAQICFNCPL